jgi:hypothetical protein
MDKPLVQQSFSQSSVNQQFIENASSNMVIYIIRESVPNSKDAIDESKVAIDFDLDNLVNDLTEIYDIRYTKVSDRDENYITYNNLLNALNYVVNQDESGYPSDLESSQKTDDLINAIDSFGEQFVQRKEFDGLYDNFDQASQEMQSFVSVDELSEIINSLEASKPFLIYKTTVDNSSNLYDITISPIIFNSGDNNSFDTSYELNDHVIHYIVQDYQEINDQSQYTNESFNAQYALSNDANVEPDVQNIQSKSNFADERSSLDSMVAIESVNITLSDFMINPTIATNFEFEVENHISMPLQNLTSSMKSFKSYTIENQNDLYSLPSEINEFIKIKMNDLKDTLITKGIHVFEI